jgi:hypothetical protein
VNVAAIWVELTTTKLLTVMPALPGLTTAPAVKFIPARLTCTVEPAAPLLGLIEVSVGATTIWEIAKVAFTDAEVAPEALNVIVHVYWFDGVRPAVLTLAITVYGVVPLPPPFSASQPHVPVSELVTATPLAGFTLPTCINCDPGAELPIWYVNGNVFGVAVILGWFETFRVATTDAGVVPAGPPLNVIVQEYIPTEPADWAAVFRVAMAT